MADRRCGCNLPHVGKQARSRTKKGRWRKKRRDTGQSRRQKSFLEKLFSF